MNTGTPESTFKLQTARKAVHTEAKAHNWLLVSILICVLFTPNLRLAGAIPVRLDDLIVFGAGAILGAECLLRFSVPKPDVMSLYCVLLIATMLLSTFIAPLQFGFELSAKDYLDALRPLKFLLVYWIVREGEYRASLRAFVNTLSISMPILLAIAAIEMAAPRIIGDSFFVRALAHFADTWTTEDAITAMTQRPFATFTTPTNLGYVAAIALFLAPFIRSRGARRTHILVSFLVLLISVTRTLLFSLPLLLILWAFARGGSLRERLRALRFAILSVTLAVIVSATLLPLISPVAAGYTNSMIHALASGNIQNEDSITTRIGNLALVAETWKIAPVLGVATRELLPPWVDSEPILTFHRYGILGLAILFAIYPIGYFMARRDSLYGPQFSQFVIVFLAITFLYGITEGALISSRIGVLSFVVIGILKSSMAQRRQQMCAKPF